MPAGPVQDPVARLAAALSGAYRDVVAHPVETVGPYPFVVVYPSAPFVAPGDYCTYELHVEVIIYLSRVNSAESLDHAYATVAAVEAACAQADASWQEMTFQPIPVGGVDHLAAVHEVTIHT